MLEVVAAGGAAEESDGEDAAVVGQRGCREAMGGSRFAEGREHDRSGNRLVRCHRQGVAGAVVEPGQDLDVGAFLDASDAAAVGDVAGAVDEPVVGEVGLPALVGLGGLEPQVAVLGALGGFGCDRAGPDQDPVDRRLDRVVA